MHWLGRNALHWSGTEQMTLFGKSARIVLSTDEATSDAYTVRKQTPATKTTPDSVSSMLGPYDGTPSCLPEACLVLQLHGHLAESGYSNTNRASHSVSSAKT